jgi:hypothetical protein
MNTYQERTAMAYGSRTKSGRKPSGGMMSKPISGMGKLTPGTHAVEVLSVVVGTVRTALILQDVAGHCHTEDLEWLDPEVRQGLKCKAVIVPTEGFVVCRDVDKFQAQDAKTRQPITGWLTDIQQLYTQAVGLGHRPASTQLEALHLETHVIKPKLYSPEASTTGTVDAAPATGPDANLDAGS